MDKKGEKKVSTFCVSKKVRSEGSPFFHLFFNRGIFWQYPNDRAQVQNLHTTFWRREDEKKKVTVTTGLIFYVGIQILVTKLKLLRLFLGSLKARAPPW